MANSMRDIKRRIRSFEKTKQITKAMEMVAASYLRRAQEQAEAARPYTEKLREVIDHIVDGTTEISHPMLESREVKRTGYLVITSDRGLAGGYNSNLLRMLEKTLEERHKSKEEYVLFVIGRKGVEFLTRRKYPVIDQIVGLGDKPTYADIIPIARNAVDYYAKERFDELYLVYNQFVNPIVQKPIAQRLLPLEKEEQDTASTQNLEIEFEPSEKEVLAAILPRYAETLIFSAFLDAKASEFAAKMTAMGNATENANELIDKLTLAFNRARQAAITQEIAEVVGGANAI